MSVLEAQPGAEIPLAAFGATLARRVGRQRPYTGEIVRQWTKQGMPHEWRGGKIVVTDLEAAVGWWRANKGHALQGGEREGAGRKRGGRSGALSVRADADITPAGGGRERAGERADGGDEEGGDGEASAVTVAVSAITVKREGKLDVETRLKELDYQQRLGKLIPREEAAEGYARVLSVINRELVRLPERLADRLAERLRLTSEERARLFEAAGEEIDTLRRWIAEHPLGEDEESTAAAAVAPEGE